MVGRYQRNVGAERLHVPVGRSVGRSVKGARWHRHDDVPITNDSGRHCVSRVCKDRIVVGPESSGMMIGSVGLLREMLSARGLYDSRLIGALMGDDTLAYGMPGLTISDGSADVVTVDVMVDERACLKGPGCDGKSIHIVSREARNVMPELVMTAHGISRRRSALKAEHIMLLK